MDKPTCIRNGLPRCSTITIAEGLKRNSRDLLALCRRYSSELLNLEPEKTELIDSTAHKSTAGRPALGYLLNPAQTMFLLSLFRQTPEVGKMMTTICKSFMDSMKLISEIEEAIRCFDFDNIQVRYVYAARDPEGRLKIGISNDPVRRIKELNAGNAEVLELIYIREAVNPRYQDETELHKKSESYRIHREWYEKDAERFLTS